MLAVLHVLLLGVMLDRLEWPFYRKPTSCGLTKGDIYICIIMYMIHGGFESFAKTPGRFPENLEGQVMDPKSLILMSRGFTCG